MNKVVKLAVQVALLLFPWQIRRWCLVRFFGYSLARTARIGISIVLADVLRMGEGSRIGNLSICNDIDALVLGENASIGQLNYLTGYPTSKTRQYSHVVGRKCQLILGAESAITSRHFVDCTGGIDIGEFTTVAGIRSQLLTHSIDLQVCRQNAKPITIGDYAFIGTGCIMLPGSAIPSYSVVAAGSLVNKVFSDEDCLYGGVPARRLKELPRAEFKYFTRATGFVV